MTGSESYDPWGNVTGTSGTISTTLGFAGGYTDAKSGFIYFRARFYDPATGAFTTLDPKVASTLAPFEYADDAPLNGTDPTGMMLASHSGSVSGMNAKQCDQIVKQKTAIAKAETAAAFSDQAAALTAATSKQNAETDLSTLESIGMGGELPSGTEASVAPATVTSSDIDQAQNWVSQASTNLANAQSSEASAISLAENGSAQLTALTGSLAGQRGCSAAEKYGEVAGEGAVVVVGAGLFYYLGGAADDELASLNGDAQAGVRYVAQKIAAIIGAGLGGAAIIAC